MKYNFNLLLTKFFNIFQKSGYFILKFLWSTLYNIYVFLKKHSLNLYKYLHFIIIPIYRFTYIALISVVELFVPIFIKIFNRGYNIFFKSFFNFLFLKSMLILDKNPSVRTFISFIINIFKEIYFYVKIHFTKVLTYFWKKIIDFLFFNVYRNRGFYFKILNRCISLFVKFFIFYLFFYKNLYLICYNFFFFDKLEHLIAWDLSSKIGLKYLILSFINVDNWFLLFYIIFVKIGLTTLIGLDFNELLLHAGLCWIDLYLTYKVDDVNFSFIKFSIDYVLQNTSVTFLTDIADFEFNSVPVFFFFGVLFFMSVILSWFFFSYLGLYGIYKFNIITLFLFWLSLIFSAKNILINQKVYIIKMCSWVFLSPNVRIDYYFLIDTISFSFMLLTTTIAFFVFIYAFSYFRYEPLVDRFLLFLLSFVISMIFLVTSGNTIMLFLGWELIGFTSFCLINFWTTKAATLKSAFKAFTFNKFSDFYMFIFLVSTYSVYYTFDILALNTQVRVYKPLVIYIFGTPVSFLEFLALLIIGAAFIKSAQLGGHAWLPDSMEAPVPASSLIHSATLVSAGVYLILRFNFIFDATQFSKFIIPVVGSLTAAYGGVCAVAQSDVKKTLAYSTISHCGFLMVLCTTEMNEFTILYLYVHGFFKAGVFMCVGNVLRIAKGYQDTRRMGGLFKYLPFEYFCAVVGVLNLAGLPFTFGFFIKHLLLSSLETHIYIYYFVIFNSLIGAFAGLFYSYRLITYTFTDFKKGNKSLYNNLNRIDYNSNFYTNSSSAATISIFALFISAYVIIYFIFKYFLFSNFNFSDYMNTTLLTNYYSTINSFNGYLLNFSYINVTVIVIIASLVFSKFRKIPRVHLIFKKLFFICLFFLYVYFFYMFI